MIPSLIHQTDNCVNPPNPGEANGLPLSVLIAIGKPNSLNVFSKNRFASSIRVS
jgi:hypothetical protein